MGGGGREDGRVKGKEGGGVRALKGVVWGKGKGMRKEGSEEGRGDRDERQRKGGEKEKEDRKGRWVMKEKRGGGEGKVKRKGEKGGGREGEKGGHGHSPSLPTLQRLITLIISPSR